jgi:hypothetical protein
MSKREASEDQSNPASKISKTEDNESSFERMTTESEWSPADGGRTYMLRYIHGETCCESPYADVDNWPTISFTAPWGLEEVEGESPHDYELSVIGAIWVKESGKFVGFWGADEGDGHVYLICSKDYEYAKEDFEPLSGILCTEICPPMIDVFDDGSGKDRDVVLLDGEMIDHELLRNLYVSSDNRDSE